MKAHNYVWSHCLKLYSPKYPHASSLLTSLDPSYSFVPTLSLTVFGGSGYDDIVDDHFLFLFHQNRLQKIGIFILYFDLDTIIPIIAVAANAVYSCKTLPYHGTGRCFSTTALLLSSYCLSGWWKL